MNKFDSVDFKKTNTKIHGLKLLKGLAVGKFTRKGVIKYIQGLSDKLEADGKDARIGVSIHYKKANRFMGATFTDAGDAVEVYDPSDSKYGAIAKDDVIDGIAMYILKK